MGVKDITGHIIMFKLAVIGCLLAVALANPSIEDCAGGNSAVKIYSINLDPYPLQFPSDLTLGVEAEILKDVNNVHVRLDLKKIILGIPVAIPCVDGLDHAPMRMCVLFLTLPSLK